MSTFDAPVARRTLVTKPPSSRALSDIRPIPPIALIGHGAPLSAP